MFSFIQENKYPATNLSSIYGAVGYLMKENNLSIKVFRYLGLPANLSDLSSYIFYGVIRALGTNRCVRVCPLLLEGMFVSV